jgi:uncharacterized cupredoxin-like copper-binding protein
MNYIKIVLAVIVAASTVISLSTYAVASPGHSSKKQETVGHQGKAVKVSRTVNIKMYENYFEPRSLNVNDGETIRFVVKNMGDAVHEFNIGVPESHAGHQVEMTKMMDQGILEADSINHKMMKSGGMMHSDPNSVLLEPGKSKELIWKFEKSEKAEFACNVPGHYEAGMKGKISFKGAVH